MSDKEDIFESEDVLKTKKDYDAFRELLYKRAIIERAEAKSKNSTWAILTLSLAMLSSIFSLVTLSLEEGRYLDKATVQNDIAIIVTNGGDLRAIKQSFSNQPTISQLKLLFSSKSSYYPETIALSSVLDDIRVQAFVKNETDLLPRLEPLIKEYEEINPFDKLQVGQKDYFENIRIKADVVYPKIKNDVNNLVDELHQKNLLVNEYLSDSKMSFWISIFAVFLSLLIGGYQIYTNRSEALRKVIIGLVDTPAEDGVKPSNKSKQSDG